MEVLLSMGFNSEQASGALRACNQDVERALDMLLNGAVEVSPVQVRSEDVISVCSVSQYTFSQYGSSACTPITCFLLSKLLPLLNAKLEHQSEEVMTDSVLSGVQTLSAMHESEPSADATRHWSSEEFMELVPELKFSLMNLGSGIQGLLSDQSAFQNLIRNGRAAADRAGHSESYVGIIVTKPPETICLCIPPRGSSPYLMYDSHSRPQLGLDGSYLVQSVTEQALVRRLKLLFPAFASEDDEGDMMSAMYNTFEGSIFVSATVDLGSVSPQAGDPLPTSPPTSSSTPYRNAVLAPLERMPVQTSSGVDSGDSRDNVVESITASSFALVDAIIDEPEIALVNSDFVPVAALGDADTNSECMDEGYVVVNAADLESDKVSASVDPSES